MAKITSEAAFEEHIEDVLLNTHGFMHAVTAKLGPVASNADFLLVT